MKNTNLKNRHLKSIIVLFLILTSGIINAQDTTDDFIEYRGQVIDKNTEDALPFANLTVEGTNIASVTNSEGEFSLKVPKGMPNAKVEVSFLGYQKLLIIISEFRTNNTVIALEPSATELGEINVTRPKSAEALVRAVFLNKGDNYIEDQTYMTAFYRETIKRRNKNVSLAEAVVNIQKRPYTSAANDLVGLYKARKSTDYSKLDTIALKLQGGPLNALYVDLIKYPDYFLTQDLLPYYEFSFGESTIINDELIYVVNFKQKDRVLDPLYYGKLYINSKTMALTNALYNLNVENRDLASSMFVRKKPNNVRVYPVEASYRVDYREKDGKWYYGYSNVQLEFVVNWKRKLFNSRYRISSEMLVTDWEKESDIEVLTRKNTYKASAILVDEASGFADPDFWGAYNVIEPEKSIESAINKIQRNLKRIEQRSQP
ncbi:carboxypeptidase-like regulatory domain-containing protein [Leeuwenhoekiella sp. A16]|uniref:carboxypeptidase-like regulatory domain-containing protein n=1 Tax=unclassified Leeuwenhoekiella TaxID=2615029 RepID=UPI003A80B08F